MRTNTHKHKQVKRNVIPQAKLKGLSDFHLNFHRYFTVANLRSSSSTDDQGETQRAVWPLEANMWKKVFFGFIQYCAKVQTFLKFCKIYIE